VTTPLLPVYARTDLAFDRGEGAYLFAADGTRYLDFGSGVAVNALGHAHPHLVDALTAQARKLWHTSNLYRIPGQERLAQRLVDASFADTVFFCNSGAEAVECALKMARRYQASRGAPGRYRIITFEGAFHGRTLATIAAGGQEKHLAGFGPKVDGFDQAAFNDLQAVERAIGPSTAGILIEPIQGEGGIRVAPAEFLRGLRALADRHGLLLLFDEVQTGIGRSGRLFAHEWAGVTPDIMALAKGIGGGFPMGACLATEKAASGMTVSSHASTFGGNPLAVAAGNAVLDIVLAPDFLPRVREMALLLKQRLARLVDAYDALLSGLVGEGLMIGLQCRVANADLVAAALEEKLILIAGGNNGVRLLPPLIIGEPEIAEAIDKLEHALSRLRARPARGAA
jgi:acetylornithine/N-succinyldiaminopimelate aminotransferase